MTQLAYYMSHSVCKCCHCFFLKSKRRHLVGKWQFSLFQRQMHTYVFSMPQVFLHIAYLFSLCTNTYALIHSLYPFLYLINDARKQTVTLTLAFPVPSKIHAIPLNEDRFIYAKYGKQRGGKAVMSLTNQMHIEYFEARLMGLDLKWLKTQSIERRLQKWWYFLPVTGMKSQICHMCLFRRLPQLCVSCHRYNISIYSESREITGAQALYLWGDYYMGMIEKHILLRGEFDDIPAFSTTSLIKVTIKALIIPCCQRAVEIIFITNTSFISECVSVMIIRALTPQSHWKSLLYREAGIA